MPSVPDPAQAQFFPQSLYTFMAPHFHPAYTIQWTLSVQRQFGHGWQAQLDYIGNTTRHSPLGLAVSPAVFIPGLWGPSGTGCDGIVRSGPAAVTAGAEGTDCSTTKNQVSRFRLTMESPDQGNFYEGGGGGSAVVQGGVNANYNGMVATIQHRLSSTFSLLANWTWSKCLNVVDAAGDYHGSNVSNPNNPGMDYGPCGSDYRSIENMSLVTRSNFQPSNRFTRLLVDDWEFAPLMSISSGGPVNVTSGQDISLTDVGSDRPNLVAGGNPYHQVSFRSGTGEANREYLNPAAFAQVTAPCAKDSKGNLLPGCQTNGTYGDIGRNSFRGPKSFSLDAQISRRFPIRENIGLDLRLEAFNALNHPNFGNPDAKLTDSKFGQVSSASAARVFQGAFKISF